MTDRRLIVMSAVSRLRFFAWHLWNRTRYYRQQAQARRRVEKGYRDFYAAHGETWKPPRPWWLP